MADSVSASAPAASGADPDKVSKLAVQLKKLTEANAKYKNLLKLAKERIQQQEHELENIRNEKTALEQQMSMDERRETSSKDMAPLDADTGDNRPSIVHDDVSHNIVRVCQRIKSENPNSNSNGLEDIWALIEMEIVPLNADAMDVSSYKRFQEW